MRQSERQCGHTESPRTRKDRDLDRIIMERDNISIYIYIYIKALVWSMNWTLLGEFTRHRDHYSVSSLALKGAF